MGSHRETLVKGVKKIKSCTLGRLMWKVRKAFQIRVSQGPLFSKKGVDDKLVIA